MPKTIAMMSTTKLMSSTLWPARYRKPSITERSPSDCPLSSALIDGSFHTAQRVSMSDAASSAYSQWTPMIGMSGAPSIGPAMAPNCITVILSEFAAGSCSGGTSRA